MRTRRLAARREGSSSLTPAVEERGEARQGSSRANEGDQADSLLDDDFEEALNSSLEELRSRALRASRRVRSRSVLEEMDDRWELE